jgi:hypothetical protein
LGALRWLLEGRILQREKESGEGADLARFQGFKGEGFIVYLPIVAFGLKKNERVFFVHLAEDPSSVSYVRCGVYDESVSVHYVDGTCSG